jgi:dCMP deaminase
MQVIVAYIPVLHQGYYQLFSKYKNVKKLYVLNDDVAQQFTPVHKELRALPHALIIQSIKSWQLFDEVISADEFELKKINKAQLPIIIPDEVVTTEVAKKYLSNCEVTKSSIFLRWDKKSATAESAVQPDSTTTTDQAAQLFMQQAIKEGALSSDWWRRVGAIAVRDGQILAQTHNTHLPSEQQPYAEGDPRAHFHKGDHIDLTTAIHAEAKLIAEAAMSGTSLQDAEMYVTDFPCPNCAKLIAHAGIKRLYFAKGYGMLDGERVLKSKNIEVIKVEQ